MYVWNYRLGRWKEDLSNQHVILKIWQIVLSIVVQMLKDFGFHLMRPLHRRLIVIDPEGGTQPKTFRAGDYTYALTYNGEIYNFRELKEQLQNVGMHLKPIQIQKYYYMLI